MISLSHPDTVAAIDVKGWSRSREKTRSDQNGIGQFLTPQPVAETLASWFDIGGLNRKEIRLMDPGAGAGMLTVEVVERIARLYHEGKLPLLKKIHLEAWELDEDMIPLLAGTLEKCSNTITEMGLIATTFIHQSDFIMTAGAAEDLFQPTRDAEFTHAILNPPYKKIASASHHRKLLESAGIPTGNLYSAFVWLSQKMLIDGGQLSAITPRSFCNGPYFAPFRKALLDQGTFDTIHLVDSRKETFSRDSVLQENILYHYTKATTPPGRVTIQTGCILDPSSKRISAEELSDPRDKDRLIHIPGTTDSDLVREFMRGLPCELSDIGLKVSTGPVVDFRLKSSLKKRQSKTTAPLVYPHCINGGNFNPPRQASEDYEGVRNQKKPVGIEINDDTRKWLVRNERFVLTKRFSSKEERRRIVAAVTNPDLINSELLGLENHLNFFHHDKAGLPEALANGLCRFLNTSVVDRYFRQFNGHTQVNVSDLRALRYPAREALIQLGTVALEEESQLLIDKAAFDLLGAPPTSAK